MDVFAILESLGGPGRDIAKALTGTVGAGTDLSALSGAGALRVENLDPMLFSVTVENKHFDLFNRLLPNKRDTFSMLDQQIVKKGTGGFPGSAVSTETATGRPDRSSDYSRLLTELGVFVDYRQVSLVTALQGVLQGQAGKVNFSSVAEENVSAALTLLETIEWSLFYADRTINGMEINGLYPQILSKAPGNVIDLAGASITDHTQIAQLAGRIAQRPQFGNADLLYCSGLVKGDLDKSILSGYRVNLDAGVPNTEVGVPIKGIKYSAVGIGQGHMEVVPHAYVDEAKTPIIVQNPTGTGPQVAPASAAGAAVAPSVTGSAWLAGHAGAYYYCVEACKPGEVSVPAVSGAVTVAAGGAIDLTISQSASGTETHYNIYRGRKGGTNAPSDMRLIARVVKAGATTVFRDLNTTIPGTSEIFILTSSPARRAMTWIQMLNMAQFPLAQTELSLRWAVLLLGALRIPDARKHALIKNVLPQNPDWKPFN